MNTPQFVVDGHLGYLQFLAVMDKVAMDIFYMCFFLDIYFHPFGVMPENRSHRVGIDKQFS